MPTLFPRRAAFILSVAVLASATPAFSEPQNVDPGVDDIGCHCVGLPDGLPTRVAGPSDQAQAPGQPRPNGPPST